MREMINGVVASPCGMIGRDDERKERMLLALERLKGRFRQVLVVTHDSAIKEQLPNAIQVEKLPGRRAHATVLSGV